MRELRQLQDEVTAALRAKKYEQDAKREPWQQIQTIKKVTKRVIRHGFRERSIAASLIEKAPKLLEELIPQDSEENGRRVVVWNLFRDLGGSVVGRVYRKVETLKIAFYLRFSFTYHLRNIENGKCHVVTCLCFVAFVGMFFSSFYSRHFCILYNVCIYICMFINIINVYIRTSYLRWFELFGQGPSAVRQGRSNCEVGVVRVAPRVGRIVSVCV
jgi:hypothetical protein